MLQQAIAAIALTVVAGTAFAAPDYDAIQIGDTIENHIGMGFATRDLPLPAGRWHVLNAGVENLGLTPRNPSGENLNLSLPMYTFTLRNTDPEALVAAMVLRFSPRASNVDWRNEPCAAADPVLEMVDSLGIASPQATLFGCVRAHSAAGWQRTIAQASPSSGARWVYDYLRFLAPHVSQMPDLAVIASAHANQYRGRSFNYLFVLRQQAPWHAPGYTNHLRQWMNTTGNALLDIARNSKTTLPLPTAYAATAAEMGMVNAKPAQPASLSSRVALDKINIRDTFEREPLSADTVAQAVRRCNPQIPANLAALHDGSLLNSAAQTITFFTPPQSNYFLVKPGDYSTCVQSSAAGYPILPGAAIRDVMEVQGVPASYSRAWYRRLALNLAIHGSTTVAFVRPDGSATIARLVVVGGSPLALRHVHYERAAGSWEELETEDQFSHPAYSGLRTSTQAGRGETVTQVKL